MCHEFIEGATPAQDDTHTTDITCDRCKDITSYYFNYDVDLKDKLCVVTGGRVKVGYHIALWLLRHGATVVITTRFPIDAQERYQKEKDYDTWSMNLYVFEVDFRSSHVISEFCDKIKQRWSALYLIVNNAAQTVKRPEYYYRHLTDCKLKALGSSPASDLKGSEPSVSGNLVISNTSITNIHQAYDIDYLERDFPDGKVDIDGQQLDLRRENTWTKTLVGTDIRECVESHLINSIAPFYIIQQLTPLLHACSEAKPEPEPKSEFIPNSHIINITSQEGRFQNNKGSTHPHNNMTKAALNMLTKTIALEYKNVYKCQVVSVDTGWANSMVGPTVMGKLTYNDSVARVIQPLVDTKNYSGTQLRHFVDVGFNAP